MTVSVHPDNPHFTEYADPAYVLVGTSGEWQTFERRSDICGKTGEPGTEEFSYTRTSDWPKRREFTVTWYDLCRLAPGHEGDCTNNVVFTDCCDGRFDADLAELASNDEVTVCAVGWAGGCNEKGGY